MPLSEEELSKKQQAIAADKASVVHAAVDASFELGKTLRKVTAVLTLMNSRGYILGGESEIKEQDLLNRAFSTEDFHKVIQLFTELEALSKGGDVTAAQWGVANAKISG